MSQNDERIDKLRELLQKNFTAPDIYMFKFIVPNNNQSMARVMSLFDASAEVNSRTSKNGSYISLTAREMMFSVESILDKYNNAFRIEGLIAL